MQKSRTIIFTILLTLLAAACTLPSTIATPTSGPVLITPTLPALSSPTASAATVLPTAAILPTGTTAPATAAPTATFPPVITATTPPTKVVPTIAGTKTTNIKITNLKMVDLNVGWAVGQLAVNDDQIFKTANGGKTWKAVTPPEPSRAGRPAVVFFMDANRAWVNYAQPTGSTAPTSFTVWYTTDGAATWKSTKTSLSGITVEGFNTNQIAFFDASDGWLLSTLGVGMSHYYIALFKTSDGGATWKAVVTPDKNNVQMSCAKSGAWFRDASHGYLAGNCYGVIKGVYFYTTADGGATWSLFNLPAPASLPTAFTDANNACGADAPRFFDAQKGSVVVSCSTATAKAYRWVYRTTDGGATWTSAPLPRPYGGYYFMTADSGWYLGQLTGDNFSDVKVYTTSDGGKNWKDISGTHWTGDQDYLDAKNGWVIAKTASDVALVRTVDGGLTYQLLTPQLAP